MKHFLNSLRDMLVAGFFFPLPVLI